MVENRKNGTNTERRAVVRAELFAEPRAVFRADSGAETVVDSGRN